MSRTATVAGRAVVGAVVLGSWGSPASAAGHFQFNSLTPCPVFDTRDPMATSPTGAGNVQVLVDVTGYFQ